jgi:hypothetical protein
MSGFGTKRTLPSCPRISAFEGKADILKAESNGPIYEYTPSVAKFRRTLEAAGIEFIDENGGGPAVRLSLCGLE